MTEKTKDKKLTSAETQETVSREPRASRTSNRKKFDRNSFRRQNDLNLPQELKDYYEAEGYFLRWVAVVDAATKEYTNSRVNHFMSMGGDLVTGKEIKSVDPTFLSGLVKYNYQEDWAEDEDDRYEATGVRKEHLVLMKIPVEYRDYKMEENRRLVNDQLSAAQQEYKKNSDTFVKDFKHGASNLKVKEGFFKD